MHQPIQDGIRYGRLTKVIMPSIDWQLRCNISATDLDFFQQTAKAFLV
jgi:hypothetical protein